MVWGLYLSLAYMMSIDRYGISVFGLEYGDEELGVISFGGPSAPPASSEFENQRPGMIAFESQVLIGINRQTGAIEITNASARAADSITNRLLLSWATTPDNSSTTEAVDQPFTPSNTTNAIDNLTMLTDSLTVDLTSTLPNLHFDQSLQVLLNTIADTAPRPHDAGVAVPWVSR